MFTSPSTGPRTYYPFGMIMPGRSGNDTIPACDTTVTITTDTLLYNDFTDDPGNAVPSTQGWMASGTGQVLAVLDQLFILSAADKGFSAGAGIECDASLDIQFGPGVSLPPNVGGGGIQTTTAVLIEIIDSSGAVTHTETMLTSGHVVFSFTAASTANLIRVTAIGPPLGLGPPGECLIDNVLIVTDDTTTSVDCAACGGAYRYGFNGKEQDSEVSGTGNQYDYGFRIYNPRLGRFLSVDPLTHRYPWYAPYQYAGNNPVKFIDLDGLERYDPNAKVTGFVLISNATLPTGYMPQHNDDFEIINYKERTVPYWLSSDAHYWIIPYFKANTDGSLTSEIGYWELRKIYTSEGYSMYETVGYFGPNEDVDNYNLRLLDWGLGLSGGEPTESLWEAYKRTWTPENVAAGIAGIGIALKPVTITGYRGFNALWKNAAQVGKKTHIREMAGSAKVYFHNLQRAEGGVLRMTKSGKWKTLTTESGTVYTLRKRTFSDRWTISTNDKRKLLFSEE